MTQFKPCVFLVGAGPGDPELLTVKALRLLESADVIVYDRLISEEIVALFPSNAKRVYVGKASGAHVMPQEQINTLILDLSHRYQRVVRLKGGDPFLFGRGSEEALMLAEHGVSFEIVPGISSAAACASYSGIPLTHRGLAQGVQLVTGHCRADAELELNWGSLADPKLTLAIYMSLSNIAEISAELLKAGRAPTTPAAIVESGTTNAQRCVLSTLEGLPTSITEHNIHSPAMVLIGEVVNLAPKLAWFNGTTTAHITNSK